MATEALTPEEREDLVAYLDGELDDAATQRLEVKLSQSPAARQEVEELKQAWGMLDYLPRPQASADFTHRTLDHWQSLKVKQARQTRRWQWAGKAAWAASILLAAVIGYGVVSSRPRHVLPEPPREDLRLMEHREYWRYYEKVESVEFLRALEKSEVLSEDL